MTPCPITADRDAWRGAVTQVDRDAAERSALALGGKFTCFDCVDQLAEVLARHRQQAEASFKAREDALVEALEAIQRWRADCASYDDECGHPERLFCEDVALIEDYAERVLARHFARAHTAADAKGGDA